MTAMRHQADCQTICTEVTRIAGPCSSAARLARSSRSFRHALMNLALRPERI
jgi:hypothetical protein